MRPASVLPDALPEGQAVILGGGVGRGLHDLSAAQHGMGVGAAHECAGALRDIGLHQPYPLGVGFLLEPGEGSIVPLLKVRAELDVERDGVAHQLTSTYQCGQRPLRLS